MAALARRILTLRGGRQLGYVIVGATDPKLDVIYHHGWPSSAQEAFIWADAAARQGVRMIAVDRPGVGSSTVHLQGLSFPNFAGDIKELMDSLKLKQAVMMGTSGGGPYAAACASLLDPDRVPGVVLVASMTHTRGPHSGQLLSGMDLSNRLGYNLLSALPLPALYVLMAAAALLARLVALPLLRVALHLAGIGPTANSHSLRPGSTAAQQTGYSTGAAAGSKTSGTSQGQASSGSTSASGGTTSGTGGTAGEPRSSGASATLTSWVTPWMGFAKADGPALASHAHSVLPTFLLMGYDVFGTPSLGAGFAQDMDLTCRPWGFSLSSITQPTLVFQGTADVNVTVAMAHWLSTHIPGASHSAASSAAARTAAGIGHADADQGCVLVDGEGHLSLVLNHADSILAAACDMCSREVAGSSHSQPLSGAGK